MFIETLSRRGYRFIYPVDGRAASNRPEISTWEKAKSSFLRPLLAIAFLVAVIVVVLAWAPWRHESKPHEITERRLTANSAENPVSSAALSRDGKYLAYTDNTGVYVKLIATGETHPVALPSNFSVHVNDWFSDGSHLLVTRQEPSKRASLWNISVFGGLPRQLAEDASAASLSPDGYQIAFLRGDLNLAFDTGGAEEWVMRSEGTEQRKIATADPDSWLGVPTWSGDGRFIAYERVGPNDTKSIEVNEWQKSNFQTILTDPHLGTALHWLPDGRLIYGLDEGPFGVQDSSLWAVPLSHHAKISGSTQLITRGHGFILHVTASADGKLVTFLTRSFSPSAYLGTFAPDGTHLLASKRFALDDNSNIPYAWTPDSKAVLLVSRRNGAEEIFKQNIDQSIAEIVASSSMENLELPRLTPDGSEILYVSTPKSATPETPSSIFVIPVGGGTPRLVLKDVAIWNVQCARLPATLCLYSVSNGNTSKTFRFDVRTGKTAVPPQIDPPQGNWSLSPDGSLRAIVVFTPKRDQNTIELRSISTGRTRSFVVNGWKGLLGVDWSANGKSLLVGWHNYRWDSALLNVTLDGKASVLVRASWPGVWWGIPSPDGRFLAIAQGAFGPSNAWQIENF
jgi:Tol biopolymer transport system component